MYDNYSAALFGIILRIVKDRSIAEDLLQQTFLKIWEKAITFDSNKSTLFTWMSTIARNTAIDMVRLKKFQNIQKTDTIDFNVHDIEKTYINESKLDINTLNALLDDKYRIVLEKIYLEGYSHADLAEELGIPLGTVKTRLRKAISIIRGELKNEKYLMSITLVIFLVSILLCQ